MRRIRVPTFLYEEKKYVALIYVTSIVHHAPSALRQFRMSEMRVKSCAVTADKCDILQRELNLNGRTCVRVPPLIAATPSKEIALSKIVLYQVLKSEQKFLYLSLSYVKERRVNKRLN